ncbi:unnamed protein product, partial [Didymodactylos carnosus]
VYNPANGKETGSVPNYNQNDAELAVQDAASKAFHKQ